MKSLTTRLVLYYSLMVTATVASALLIGLFLLRLQLTSGTDFLLEKEFMEIRAKLADIPQPATPQHIHEAIHHHAMIDAALFFFQVHDGSGQILFRSANLGDHLLPDLTAGDAPTSRNHPAEGLGLLRVSEYHVNDLHVQLATSLNYLERITRQGYLGLAVALPVVLLISVLVGFSLSQITLRPLRLIQTTARRINATNLNERIPIPPGKDELTHLANLLNDMFDRLETSFTQIKQITADTSHELRTPLTIMRLHIEKVLDHGELPSSVREDLGDVCEEIRRLNTIIDQIMVLAKAESQTLPLHLRPVSTAEFLAHFEEDAATLAEHQGRHFKITCNDDVTTSFDAGWMRQVLFNLLSNALRHSPPGSTIRLESKRHNGHWQATLSDEGPGVPPDKLEHIFNRFMQVHSSPGPAQGSGLGLAVCKSIVELHHGSVRGQNIEGHKGFAVTFEIPVSSQN